MLGISSQQPLERLQSGKMLFERDSRSAQPVVDVVAAGIRFGRKPVSLTYRSQCARELVRPVEADAEEQMRSPKRRIQADSLTEGGNRPIELVLQMAHQPKPLPCFRRGPGLQFFLVGLFRNREIAGKFRLPRGIQLRRGLGATSRQDASQYGLRQKYSFSPI